MGVRMTPTRSPVFPVEAEAQTQTALNPQTF
jgi:hypothetical protein